MGKKPATITDPDLAKVGVALQRAAEKARQLGFDTNTPVYIFRNGKIVDIVAEHRATQSPKKRKATNSQRKTTSHQGKAQSKKIR